MNSLAYWGKDRELCTHLLPWEVTTEIDNLGEQTDAFKQWIISNNSQSVNQGFNYINKDTRAKKLLEMYDAFPQEVKELIIVKNKKTPGNNCDFLEDQLAKATERVANLGL